VKIEEFEIVYMDKFLTNKEPF